MDIAPNLGVLPRIRQRATLPRWETRATKQIRVLLIDSDSSVRRGLRMALDLEPDVAVVGEAGCAETALELARALQPDVVLTEAPCCVPGNPLPAERLRQAAPCCSVIVLTIFDDIATRAEAAASGVAAFVGKHESHETLLASIRRQAR